MSLFALLPLVLASAGSPGHKPPPTGVDAFEVASDRASSAPDTFEIVMGPGSGGSAPQVVRMEADQVEIFQGNMVILRQGDSPVAAVQLYQILVVFSRSAEGRRTFEVLSQTGSSVLVSADRMVPDQNGAMSFYAAERLVAIANPNGVRMILDRGARVKEP